MRYIKLDLLTLLISLFLLNACKKPDGIGLEISPDKQIDASATDTVTVRAYTVKEDSVITRGQSQSPLGYLQDEFGTTEANLAMALTLPQTGLTFGTSPVLDSAVLVLKYGDTFYGDADNSTYAVNVHQLNETFNLTANYYNTKQWNYNSTVIGSKTVNNFALQDSVLITDIVSGKPDTARVRYPQLRIPISSSFINNNFLNAGSDKFATTTAFNNFIKGLYLTINKSQSSGKGGVVFFDLATADSSRLEIYYRTDDGTTKDTIMTTFSLSSSNAAASIKHDYSTQLGPKIQEQVQANKSIKNGVFPTNPPLPLHDTLYVQPLGGLRTLVNFPYIKKLKELGNFTINKAELVVEINQDIPTSLKPAPRLGFYCTDIAGQRQPIPDNNGGQTNSYGDIRALPDGSYGGLLQSYKKDAGDFTHQRYVFIITSYLQDLLDGRSTQYNAYIAPVKSGLLRSAGSKTDILPSVTTAAPAILGGNSGNYKIRLNIIYTKLN
ncbi:DUF4270 domain-containing protein [Pedobacter sp. BS3]|uniref:DUF4270 domain-containing protein n=1 Tax=Pedobacter sp. BS3 TaxID=2567937 RepID=UPI0011EF70D2|nr:DUF4270 domain-containing protein [Pedobacter sp. BS3]TZF82032.1 DUF4270 domain-containing protein [Pedobacter sp. BS3]